MATKKGCFTILGEISWIILWISFTFALFIDYSSSEEVFNLKENISVLLIWLVPLFIYLLFYYKTNFYKLTYYVLYVVFSFALFKDGVMDQFQKSSIWIMMSFPIIFMISKLIKNRKIKKQLEEKLKKIKAELKLKETLKAEREKNEKIFEEIKRNKFNSQFIEKLKIIHSDRPYKYELVKYINNENKIEIECEIHDVFKIYPMEAAKGKGCPKCAILNTIMVPKNDIVDLKINKNDNEKNKLAKIMEDTIKNQLENAVFELKKGQKSIKSDTRKILTNTNKMMSEVQEIKSLTKKTNESIEKSISQIISSVEKNHDFNTIEEYIPKVTEWFKFWDKIEENTKTFMPGSEWLYDNIKSSDFQDYSPFVLYYCRALENELLKKIFLSFHDHVNEMGDDELKSLFLWNKEGLNEKKIKEYQTFFNQFKTNILKNRKKYTLGDMRLILNLLPNTKNKKGSIRFNISPLLKELNKFIKNKIGGIESETIKRLENLIINYRNKSAHVDIIEEEKALIFYNEFKIIMNKLIGKF